jgi:hypothetical protein
LGRVGVVVKEDASSILTKCSIVARVLGSTLLILTAGSNVGFTGIGFWSMALGSIQWAVGRECGKGLDG